MNIVLGPNAPLDAVIRIIEANHHRICIVVNDSGELIGTVTDGDVRRSLLNNHTLDLSASDIMNPAPLRLPESVHASVAKSELRRANLSAAPLVSCEGKYVGLIDQEGLVDAEFSGARVLSSIRTAVIMAGGKGTRLHPLTSDLPKPLLRIGNRSIIDILIGHLVEAGITKIFISVNYLAEKIISELGDGSSYGVSIEYLHEDKELGTAGCLSLLDERATGDAFICVNGDVLSEIDYVAFERFYREQECELAVGGAVYSVDIPYGVLVGDESGISEIIEKPSYRYLCNAGVYILSHRCLNLIPRNEFFNFDGLIMAAIDEGLKTVAFPIHESWSDLGTHDSLSEAREKYNNG